MRDSRRFIAAFLNRGNSQERKIRAEIHKIAASRISALVATHPKFKNIKDYHLGIEAYLSDLVKHNENTIYATYFSNSNKQANLQDVYDAYREDIEQAISEQLDQLAEPENLCKNFNVILSHTLDKFYSDRLEVINKVVKDLEKLIDPKNRLDAILYLKQTYKNKENKLDGKSVSKRERYLRRQLKNLLASPEWTNFLKVKEAKLESLRDKAGTVKIKKERIAEQANKYCAHLEAVIQKGVDDLPSQTRQRYYTGSSFDLKTVLTNSASGGGLHALGSGIPLSYATHPKLHGAINKYREMERTQALLDLPGADESTQLYLFALRVHHPAVRAKISAHRNVKKSMSDGYSISRGARFLRKVSDELSFIFSPKKTLSLLFKSRGHKAHIKTMQETSTLFKKEELSAPSAPAKAVTAA